MRCKFLMPPSFFVEQETRLTAAGPSPSAVEAEAVRL